MKENKNITRILKYLYDNQEVWIYSVKDRDKNNDILYRYYTMFFKERKPIIIDLQDPIQTLQNIDITPLEIKEGSIEYIKFLALKDIAEKDIITKMRK